MTLITRRHVLVAGTATVGALLVSPAVAGAATATATGTSTDRIIVRSGQTLVISTLTRTGSLTIESGGAITAPSGYRLTMTVDGVDTGEQLTATGGADTAIQPGSYRGDIVLTPQQATDITWAGVSATLIFPFRQGLYVDDTGVVAAKSVLAAVLGGQVTAHRVRDVRIGSTGEAFNAVYAADGSFALDRPRISLSGNGRCDFVGYGAAIVGDGANTTLVVDGATIDNIGAVRTGVIANDGANVIVKNSRIATRNGVLPADYVPTVDTTYMESAPWMLGISGNVRATNLLGTDTKATYLNSSIASEGWGVLSSDNGQDGILTAINCQVRITGQDGYGSYAIGNATERFLGCQFDVGTYATINRGGAVHYGDSTRAVVAQLNSSLDLGLTAAELAALALRPTVVTSRRFGFMWHGAGSLTIDGGTQVDSAETMFLDKGQQVSIAVDGSAGVQLNPRNGILVQVMENDDPGPVLVDGRVVNEGVYTEPTGTPTKVDSFDVTAVHDTDAVAGFTDIALTGDFYNAMRGDAAAGGGVDGLNLALTFTRSQVRGVISATAAKHQVTTISSANYLELGEVTNTVQPVINNGVLVDLAAGSRWTVTGTSYLSALTLADDAKLLAPVGRTVSMTVNGTATPIAPGAGHTGAITLTVR
ncbi:MAG TPA: hypothetical protein VG756_20820 [Pseudonocardiaceae bacterium]|nr:hypothetical protein [Pseudonocardiaceae bacterium]